MNNMPILAEIADKMPTVESMWVIWAFIGCLASGLVLGISFMRWWRTGAVVVILSGIIGVLAATPDGMDDAIIWELGEGYLLQKRLSGFAPFALTLLTWILIRSVLMRRPQPIPTDP